MFYCAENDTNRRVERVFSTRHTQFMEIFFFFNNYFLRFLVISVCGFSLSILNVLKIFIYSNALSSSSEPCLKCQVSSSSESHFKTDCHVRIEQNRQESESIKIVLKTWREFSPLCQAHYLWLVGKTWILYYYINGRVLFLSVCYQCQSDLYNLIVAF